MAQCKLALDSAAPAGAANAAIQAAVDEMGGGGGGTVVLPAGKFELTDAVHLRTGVALVGQGGGTVLRKAPSASSPILDWLGYGHYELTVERPKLFPPGTGVLIEDAKAFGFYATAATVTAVEGCRLFIDRPLNHDYTPADGGRVVRVFPLVAAQNVRDVRVADLVLDGGHDPERMNGCRGAGVFMLGAHGAVIEDVEVRAYNGDAVSFQQCTDVVVRGCRLHDNAGGGIHPGSGSVRYLLSGNDVHDNGGDGVFYCLRTTHSLCEGNSIRSNAGAGISIGERDTDHLIVGNRIGGNGGPGVVFRPVGYHGGDRVVLRGNALDGNGDAAEVVIATGIRDVTLEGNTFARGGAPAVAVGQGSRAIHLVGNVAANGPLGKGDVDDAGSCVVWDQRDEPLHVGPGAARASDARHLAVQLSATPPFDTAGP